jgi:hypothetical protein
MAASQFVPSLEAWVIFDSAFGPKRPIAINAFLVDGVFTKAGDVRSVEDFDNVARTVLSGAGIQGDDFFTGNEELIPLPAPRTRRKQSSDVNQNVTVLWYRASINEASHAEILVAHPFAEVMMKLAAAKGQAYEQTNAETNPRKPARDQGQSAQR